MLASRSARRLAAFAEKEGRACLAPALPCRGVLHRGDVEQRPGEYVSVEHIGTRCGHEFAKLAHTAFLERLRLVGQRLEFRIEVPWFTHRKVFH